MWKQGGRRVVQLFRNPYVVGLVVFSGVGAFL